MQIKLADLPTPQVYFTMTQTVLPRPIAWLLTENNIREREEFVIHIASSDQLHPLNQSSASLPPGESEVDANDLKLTKVAGFRMPRLADCKIAYFCERHNIQMIGSKKQQALLFAEVKEIYVADDCAEINDQGRLKIHADRIRPLSRLGASEYASFGEVLSVKRPA